MKRNSVMLYLMTITLFVLAGCSSSSINPINTQPDMQPIDPMLDIALPVSEADKYDSNRDLLGIWNVKFDIENLTASVTTDRTLSGHFNVTAYVPYPVISVNSYNPLTRIIDVDVTINNPTSLNGYDVRLILFTDNNGIKLMNPDDWTALWDIPGGSMINPFRAYAKRKPERIFEAQSQNTERLQVYLPLNFTDIKFAIDACFPGHCEEPYAIHSFVQGRLKNIPGAQTLAEVSVFDWQNDVSEVLLYCPAITGQPFIPFSQIGTDRWRTTITNNNNAPAGEYSGVIFATSNGTLYDMVRITVTENLIAKWTIFYYVYEENLYSFRTNLNEMEVVGSVEGVLNLVALWDKPNTADDVILEIRKDPAGLNSTIISPAVEDFGEVIPPEGLDMHDPDTLYRFLKWGFREYPAENFGFTLLSHGNGGVYGFPPSKSFFDDMMVWEFNDAARAALDEFPHIGRLEFVGMESCTMSFIETAYALRGCTRITWASEYLMYVYSARWDQVLAYFVDHIDEMDGYDFADLFVQNTLATGGAVVYTAWDSDLVESVVIPALTEFANQLILALPGNRAAIEQCRLISDDWGSECTDPRITDLGFFAENLIAYVPPLPASLTTSAANLINAIDTAIFSFGVTGTGTGCYYSATGWQILFTDRFDDPDQIYQFVRETLDATGIGADTPWDDFLSEYDDNNY